MRLIQSPILHRFTQEILLKLGLPQQDAWIVADTLIQANLEGADSHGISRLPIYAKRLMEKRIEANPNIHMEPSGSIIKVDGGNGLGQVVTIRAIEAAIPVARSFGMAGIAVRHSNHIGAASYYCQKACKERFTLIAMTNSPPGIVPTGGRKAYLGTNPIAFGFPTKTEPPILIDMSSSVVARGKIILAAKQGESIPAGWAIDEEGLGTTDAMQALKGAVLPLGGAKGYALATAIELLTGVLSGAAFGPHVQSIYDEQGTSANVGHFFILIDISHFMPIEEYYARVEQFQQEIKAIPKAKGMNKIYVPGERRYLKYKERIKIGIPLSEKVWDELEQLAQTVNISFSLK